MSNTWVVPNHLETVASVGYISHGKDSFKVFSDVYIKDLVKGEGCWWQITEQ